MSVNDYPIGTKECPECNGWGEIAYGQGDDVTLDPCRNCDEAGYIEIDDDEEPPIYSKRCPQCGEGSDHYTIAGVCFECGYES